MRNFIHAAREAGKYEQRNGWTLTHKIALSKAAANAIVTALRVRLT